MPARRKYLLYGGGAAIIIIIVIVLLLMRSHGSPTSPPSAAPNSATTPTVSLSPITADFHQQEFATYYTVTARSSSGVPPVTWHLDPPGVNQSCAAFSSKGAQAIWRHADSNGCDHTVQGSAGHLGTVSATVSDGRWTCKATYFGTNSGKGSPAQCTQQ